MKSLVVLISGSGSNLKALLDAVARGEIRAGKSGDCRPRLRGQAACRGGGRAVCVAQSQDGGLCRGA